MLILVKKDIEERERLMGFVFDKRGQVKEENIREEDVEEESII